MPDEIGGSKNQAIHVVALALIGENSQVLVSQRPKDKDLGGLWEFPGGKLENGEAPFEGLKREIKEELDYDLKSAKPLKSLHHNYPDFSVFLDVWVAYDVQADVHSAEGQPIRWVSFDELQKLKMPEAGKPILKALELELSS